MASTSPRNLSEMQILGPYPRTAESESLEFRPGNLCFNKPSRWLLMLAKVWEHWSRLLRKSEKWEGELRKHFPFPPAKTHIWIPLGQHGAVAEALGTITTHEAGQAALLLVSWSHRKGNLINVDQGHLLGTANSNPQISAWLAVRRSLHHTPVDTYGVELQWCYAK